MQRTITIKDETAAGKILNQILLEVENEIITVEELIRMRVQKEVEHYNSSPSSSKYFKGLVQPTDTELALNGKYKLKKHRQVDSEKQCYIALKAFQNNGFFILVDNLQVEKLKHEIHVDENTELSFIKLTQLVGG